MVYGRFPSGFKAHRAFADTSFGQLHYRKAGEGPPLVLLHNTWLSSRMFSGVMPDLAKRFTVYAIDTLGQGDSDPAPDGEQEIEVFARALIEAIDDLGIGPTHLAGHHTGGVIASELAIQAPDRLRKMVISGIPYWRNPSTRLAQVTEPFFADWVPVEDGSHLNGMWDSHSGTKRFGLDNAVESFLDYMKPGPRTSLALRGLFRWDSTQRLPMITVPTLVICAETDGFVKRISDAQALIPNSQLKILPGGDKHPLHDEAGFVSSILSFCSD